MTWRFASSVLLVLLVATSVWAQAVTSRTLNIYAQGGGTPITAHVFPAAETQCGQARVTPPAGTVANPRYVRWADPANTTLDCVWDSGATAGPLFALPFSSTLIYEAALVQTNTAGAGPESARSNPFARPGVAPAAATNLRLTGS